MADFTDVNAKSNNMRDALSVLQMFKSIYSIGGSVEEILNRYNTDIYFKTEADHLFNVEQLAEIGLMISEIKTLRSGWGEIHRGPLGILS